MPLLYKNLLCTFLSVLLHAHGSNATSSTPNANANANFKNSHIKTKTTLAKQDNFLQAMQSKVKAPIHPSKSNLKAKLFANARPYKSSRSLGYYGDDGGGDDGGGDDDEYSGYGFDISQFSLKYASCGTIRSFSDDMAADEDSDGVLDQTAFVVFRLCPSDSCMSTTTTTSSSSSSTSDSSGSSNSLSTYGCMSDYGEYMIPLEDWLSIIGEYREEEMERYCDYCSYCAPVNDDDDGNDQYYNNGAENRGDKYYNYGDLDDAYNQNNEEADDGGVQDDANEKDDGERRRRRAENAQYDCSYTDACSGYSDICYNDDQKIDFTGFYECVKFNYDDDTVLYVGPHCSADKSSIVLSVFEDEYCTEYVGDKYDLYTLTGQEISSDSLESYTRHDCISCQESQLPFQQIDNDADDNDNISEICENLYNYAAKCNRYIGSANDNSYQSYQQVSNEYAVCSFIHSVVTGSYDEYGYIYVDASSYRKDNRYNEYAEAAIRKDVVTLGQALGVTFFVFALVGMAGYASWIRRQVDQRRSMFNAGKEPLNEGAGYGRGVAGAKAITTRQDSGILRCRSDSDESYHAPKGRFA